MNTKKAIWLKRPDAYIKTTVHSFSWKNRDTSSVFFTIGEEGSIVLKGKSEGEAEVEFVFLHTPSDTVAFSQGGIRVSFFGLNSAIPTPVGDSVEMKKTNEEIVFLSGETELYRLSHPAFLGSASFGLKARGEGTVTLEVF